MADQSCYGLRGVTESGDSVESGISGKSIFHGIWIPEIGLGSCLWRNSGDPFSGYGMLFCYDSIISVTNQDYLGF